MFHGRRAAIMGLDLPGSPAWNRHSQLFAPHFWKYRMFSVAVQQRFYGRQRFARLPFAGRLHHESFGVEPGPLPLLSSLGLWGKEPT
jgi:hypothetical protein